MPTSAKASALGRAVRDAQARAGDYERILSLLEGEGNEHDAARWYYLLQEKILDHATMMRVVEYREGETSRDVVDRLIEHLLYPGFIKKIV